MTATLTRPEPATCTEVLPVRSAGPAAITWRPSPGGPGLGLLRIDQKRASVVYLVQEFPTPWDGRGFAFSKGGDGTDPEAEGYEVFCGSNGQDHRCDCKGHEYHGHCKHVDAAYALIANNWI